jgi:diacylglycerol kinase family enzyme
LIWVKKYLKEGNTLIVAIGENSILNSVVNGVLYSGKRKEVAIGYIPIGKHTDIIDTLYIPKTNTEKAIEILHAGYYMEIDVTKITCKDTDKKYSETDIEHFFIGSCTFGSSKGIEKAVKAYKKQRKDKVEK